MTTTTVEINLDTSNTVDIDFKHVTVSVNPKVGQTKQIIKNVSGRCRKGRLMAIMGPSGAGKTTLLDVLVGNIYGGLMVEGEILVNGVPRNLDKFKKLTCYVYQKDVLLAAATVEEAILTSAFLRLPKDMSRNAKRARVDQIINDLGLSECRKTIVGDEQLGIKGISGGQMRRLSVGIELVTDPKIIFLDEPTSGLDSEVALSIMQTLKLLSSQSRTVICTIHQPNSDIVETFDDFMLMAKGRVTYGGKWSKAIEFFNEAGYPCPNYKNPTDYFMSQVSIEEKAEQIADTYEKMLETIAFGDGKFIGTSDRDVEGLVNGSGLSTDKPNLFDQTMTLLKRNLINWWRNPMMFWAEFTQYAFMALFSGLMYLQITDEYVRGSYDRFASIFFVLVVIAFIPPFTACVTWDKERKLLARELSTNSYHLASFYLAKLLALVPFELTFNTVFCLIAYFMIGYQAEVGKFFIFWSVFFLCLLIAESLGQVCAISTKESTFAIVFLTLIIIVLISFTGFLVLETPSYFVWVQKISFLNFASSAITENEFNGLEFTAKVEDVPEALLAQLDNVNISNPYATIKVPGELVTTTNEIVNSLSIGENIAVLAGMCVGLRIINYIGLIFAYRFKLL